MKWQTGAKIGGITLLGLFTILFAIYGAEYTFSGNAVCDQLKCPAYINYTHPTWTICFDHPEDSQAAYLPIGLNDKLEKTTIGEYPNTTIFKKSRYGRTLWVNLNNVDNVIKTEPEIPVEWYVPTVKRYANHSDEQGYWRPIKDGDCWKRLYNNKNKLVGYPSEGQRTEWSFILDDIIDIDPEWISWNYIYENLSRQVPVYEEEVIVIDAIFHSENDTWTPESSYVILNIIGYYTEYYNGRKLGVNVGGTIYNMPVNVENDKLYTWSIPIGDRNFVEYGKCREYEMEKGVCKETAILQ